VRGLAGPWEGICVRLGGPHRRHRAGSARGPSHGVLATPDRLAAVGSCGRALAGERERVGLPQAEFDPDLRVLAGQPLAVKRAALFGGNNLLSLGTACQAQPGQTSPQPSGNLVSLGRRPARMAIGVPSPGARLPQAAVTR
jgi:hypothetical protein